MNSSPSDDSPAPKEKLKSKELTRFEQIYISLTAGGVAGAVAKTSIAPLDRCKINFQINNEQYTTRNAIAYLRNGFNKDGVLALFRGNSATMARILPYAAIQFSSHEQFKRMLDVNVIRPGTTVDDVEIRRFLAGSLAGVTSQSLTYPLDLARARMAVSHDSKFSSLSKVFKITYRDEGFRGFYRGYIPTVLGVIPYAGGSFFTYETLKQWYSDLTNGNKPGTLERLGFGAISGVCGQSVSYPLDIVRRRMQTAIITGKIYKTVLQSLITIYKNEGIIGGYYKGLSMNWIKGPIAAGISFASYDFVKDLFTEAVLLNR